MNFDDILADAHKSLESGRNMAPHREAIAGIESGGDYRAVGPVTKSGDRALGKYQVMARNLPEWSQEALGRAVSPKEFLASPELQDKIFDHKFGQYLDSHGPADAASMWFTGKPLAEGAAKRDQLGTTGSGYVDQYLSGLEKGTGLTGSVSEAPQGDSLQDIEKGLDNYFKENAPPPKVEALPSASPTWGALQNLGSEALLGAGNPLSAYAQASREMFRDMARGVPREEAAKLAKEVYYPQALGQYGQAQKAYEDNPATSGTALTTKILGQAVPMLAGVGAMNLGLRGIGAIAPRVAPLLASVGAPNATLRGIEAIAPRVTSLTNFLTGLTSGGRTAQLASDIGSGALQGAAGNTIVGQDPKQGALWGGALNPVGATVARAVMAPERATMRPEVARAVEAYTKQGGEVPPATVIGNQGLAERVAALSGRGDVESVEKFNELLAKRIDAIPHMEAEGVRGLTPEVMKGVKGDLDDAFANFDSTRFASVDRPFITELHDVLRDARAQFGTTRPEVLKEIQQVAKRLYDTAMSDPNFIMSGRDIRALTTSGSPVDELFNTKIATPYAKRLKDSLYSMLGRSDPEGAQELAAINQKYKDFKRLEKVASTDPTGLINPRKVAQRYGKESDSFGDIAAMGHYLPVLSTAGATKGHTPGLVASIAERISPGIGRAAIGVGTGLGLAQEGAQLLPWAAKNPLKALQYGGLGLIGYAARAAMGNRYGSPEYLQKLVENTLRPTSASPFINPLLPAVPVLSQRNPEWSAPF